MQDSALNKRAILLINIGSPNSYKTKDVKKYLRQFLFDGRVITMPAILRFILVNLIIVPFRAKKSAAKYKQIWTKQGSPLIDFSRKLTIKLQKKLNNNTEVFLAMRYGNPSLESVLTEIKKKQFSELIVLPMYPQYASSTTESSIQELLRIVSNWETKPQTKLITSFWDNTKYINALAKKLKAYNVNNYDHLVISYHGLPLKQVHAMHGNISCDEMNCINELNQKHGNCYQSVCYRQSELIANAIGINKENYSVSFQSRLTKNWLSPFTDKLLINLAQSGKKRVIIICPSFVADCLETLHEIEIEYNEVFKQAGGEQLTMVPALNDSDEWVVALEQLLCELNIT